MHLALTLLCQACLCTCVNMHPEIFREQARVPVVSSGWPWHEDWGWAHSSRRGKQVIKLWGNPKGSTLDSCYPGGMATEVHR